MIWVMHQIIKLGKEVTLEMLPSCLDQKAKDFLIKTVNIDRENEKLKIEFKKF